jgi:diguanylate cyclase (GGDEF)-like protein/PAS domain S-box-containing protein
MLRLNSLFAVGYFLGGYLGTLISIPPSHASPIWPAAGIALAGLVAYGRWLLPGIWLGAFLTQAFAFLDTSSTDTIFFSLLMGAVASTAATAQATVGAWLIKRYVGSNNPLIDAGSILRFMALGGPVSCVLSASAGVLTLYLKGVVNLNSAPASWVTWWIGDTIGVLIFTPVLLCFIGQARNPLWRKRLIPVALPLTLLSLLVLVILHFGKLQEQARLRTLFEEHSTLLHHALQHSLSQQVEINRNLKALFDSSATVTAKEFHSFTKTVLSDHPDIQALEWIPRITDDQRALYEQHLGSAIQVASDQPRLKPAPPQAEYFPITYLEPYLGNERARGLDITSRSPSFEALQKARDTTQTTLSGVIRLVQDPNNRPNVVIYSPVYQADQPLQTREQRRQHLVGFVANVIRVSHKVNSLIHQFERLQLLLKITDAGNELVNQTIQALAPTLDFSDLQTTLPLTIADRTWQVTYRASPEFYHDELSWNIWWLILGGFCLTGLTGIGLLVLTGRTLLTEAVVKARTQELQQEIDERKTAEAYSHRLAQLYALLSQCNQAIVRCKTQKALFQKICRDSVQIGGLKMAWIGLIDSTTKRIQPIASSGHGVIYLKSLGISLDPDNVTSQGPCATAIRKNQPVWCQDFLNEAITSPWHARGARFGWRALAVLPIYNNGVAMGVFSLYADQINAFDEAVRDLLVEIALDISFALDNFDREVKRKQAEASLQKSEQFLRTIIETEPECVKVIDRNGQLLEMNTAGLNMLEVDSLDAVNQTTFLHFVLPSYRDAFIALHKRVISGETGSLEFEISGLKCTRRWLETYAAPLPDQSRQTTLMLAVTRDITQRKQAEQALQASENRLMLAIKGSSDAPWDWDLEKHQLYYSPQWWHMLGYEIDELASDAAVWQSLVHPDDREFIQQNLRIALESGQDTHSVEFRLRHKKGYYVPILERSFITRNKEGKVVRVSGTNMDLTERHRAQSQEIIRSFMLECLTSSMPLTEILVAIVLKLESLITGALCSILLLDTDGQHLRLGAAPSLPNFFNQATDGMQIGENFGCCGHAAFTGQSTSTLEITQDPNCLPFKTLAEQAGLVSCWSEPILGLNKQVLGTFALYQRFSAVLDNHQIQLIRTAAHYVSITIERKRTEIQLKLAAQVFEQSNEGFMITDAHHILIKVNPAFSAITGYSESEALGKSATLLDSGHHDQEFERSIKTSIEAHNFWQGEVWKRRKNGEVYPELLNRSVLRDSAGHISQYVDVFADITQLKASEAQLEFLAHHDPLTALPNRLRLFFRLEHAIDAAKRDNKQLALLMLDLDRFKDVNDSFGHLAGDQLLQLVAAQLKKRLRDIDTVCRLGGDEFTVLLEDIAQPEDAARIAQIIISDLCEPWTLSTSIEVLIGVSIGISLYPQHGDTPELLLQHADAAMYKAKESGRNRFAYFSNEFTEAARERIALEGRLRRAIIQNELRVYYQPQIDIATGKIIGAEALVRWQNPVDGLIPPNRFIPVAEQTGLIMALGAWVLKETCRQGRQWLEAGFPPMTLAVNVSPHQLRQGDLSALVAEVLMETGFPAEYLELELTESGLMERQTEIITLMNNLRAQGIRLAIDDFGTGYSSLAYLKRFPLDVLKIDKSFIDDIPHHQDDMEIAATIIAMGHTLGFKVLAEGVETQEQLTFLEAKGCDYYQGYLKSRPLPADDFTVLLRTIDSERNILNY